MTKLHLLFALTVVASCGDDTAAPPPPPPAPRTITGAATFVTTDEAGHATRFPIGLHDTLISAQFPRDDGWDVIDAVTDADGTFAIAGAPDGDYWLETYDVPTEQRQLLWTNATTLAFEERGVGRGDAVAAGPQTTITFGPLDGLDPVEDSDGLELASGNLGLSANLFGALPPAGETTAQFTRAWTGQPLVSAAAHDTLVLAQVRPQVDPEGIAYLSPIKSATFASIEQVDGRDTRVTGAFTTPPALVYDLRWHRSAFAAASADIHPTRVGPVAGESFTLRAMPGGTGAGTSPFAPGVLDVDAAAFGTDATDFDHTFTIPNPYPASWLFNDFSMQFVVAIPVPGTPGAQYAVGAQMEVNTGELASAAHPIEPLVTPPRTPTLDGHDAFVDRDGVGVTPAIGWAAPAHGTPTAYVVRVLRWGLQFDNYALDPIATLIVPGDVTGVRMPANVLVPGEHYVLELAAISQAGQEVRTHSVYARGVPYGYAELYTNTFSP